VFMYSASYFCATAAKLELESTWFSKNPKCKIQQKSFQLEPVFQCGGTGMTKLRGFSQLFCGACEGNNDNDNKNNNNNLSYICN